MRILPVLIIAVLLVISSVDSSLIPGKGLTTSLQEVWDDDHFAITLSNVKSKKKGSEAMVETLLAVKYGAFRKKTMLMVDRRTKRVILESINESGHRTAHHIHANNLREDAPSKNVIVSVHQNQPNARIDVFIDCIYQGTIPLKKHLRELVDDADEQPIEAFRERRSQAKVYRSSAVADAFKDENCPDHLADTSVPADHSKQEESVWYSNTDDSNRSEDFVRPDDVEQSARSGHSYSSTLLGQSNRHAKRTSNGDRGRYTSLGDFELDRDWDRLDEDAEETDAYGRAASNYKRTPRRGDISIQSLDEKTCVTDVQLVKTLNELIEATKRIWREIELNRVETQHLRHLIENCAGCRERPGE